MLHLFSYGSEGITLDTAACGLELPKALLASLRAMVFCCFASACQEVILDLCFKEARFRKARRMQEAARKE